MRREWKRFCHKNATEFDNYTEIRMATGLPVNFPAKTQQQGTGFHKADFLAIMHEQKVIFVKREQMIDPVVCHKLLVPS